MFKEQKILNINQLNFLRNIMLIHRVRNKMAPTIFLANSVSLGILIQQIIPPITF